MISDEEKREIIEQAKQEFMLMLPDIIGNLMANHAAYARLNTQFYKDYPEFKDHKEAVVSVLSQVDGEDTLASYEEKLKKAIPLIRDRIKTTKGLDMTKVDRNIKRNFCDFQGGNGEL